METTKPMSRRTKATVWLAGTALLWSVALLVIVTVQNEQNAQIETVQGGQVIHVENIFVDMNGDGRLDLVVSGEVIYNATR
jgi:hypothetical protein